MRKGIIITTAIASGVVITALIATPSIAAMNRGGDPQGTGPTASSIQPYAQTEHMNRMGDGMGSASEMGAGMGAGNRAGMQGDTSKGMGMGAGLADVASGTMNDEQKASLTALAAEEKVAHDLYVAFAEKYDVAVFSRIARSETMHLDAVRTLLERYSITDPTIGLEVGRFPTDASQKLYDTLLSQGSASVDAARETARTVETTDIADLTAASAGVTAPDVLAVYEHLLTASQHHLSAFGG
ncbi:MULTISPECIES: DUF2202 domain-containing protein [unclassified Cryobacterium]|uniref:DUF2202 domain-containing protein n=1 Tax=unclassified Cryobacterium TaxID=2649013 RepID=UPI002AB32B0D|nr:MULTISPECIES: DUF2202 domain-containing protein [unclassified Cryobacterium]MDY7528241.1 DUF2202 domain-containing protein [Cryobacterium sp. 10C2]MDY7556013.1 DUF2202 domain-containing protein [Cryobacterium sp. 10C3]MEB0002394.1 DUF2202 domain-containing protein [Cryobacterium sp. RTC2.1]MEB0289260.1 DUF2202 domain-containing protein [Cryobacterium sp. 10C2]